MACFVFSCKSHSSRKKNNEEFLSFHRLPSDSENKENWFKAIPRARTQWNKHSKICSKHFTSDCFIHSEKWRRLKLGSTPSLFLDDDERSGEREPLQPMRIDDIENMPTTSHVQDYFKPNPHNNMDDDARTGEREPLQLMRIDDIENMPTTSHVQDYFKPNPHIGDENNISVIGSACCSELMHKIHILEQNLERSKKLCRKRLLKINALRKQTKRLKQKNLNLNDKLQAMLEEQNLEQDKLLIIDAVKNNKIIQRYLSKQLGNMNKAYDLEIKKFAVTLHYLSPRAYNFVREELDNILPHSKTIAKWYQGIDCNPGFTTEALDALKLRVDANKGKPIYCALSMDEMAIRRIIEWDGTNYFGYVNMGCDLDSDAVPLAKEALTFMLTSVNDTWKIPVGYFLIKSITAQEKASLVQQCLTLLKDAGVHVVSLTFDGAATNKTMCKDLGCDISSQLCYFNNNERNVCIWPDPCHNIKLVRNAFAEKKQFIDIQGKIVDWKYIELLNQLQNEEGLHLANKLRFEHVNYVKQKMKVRLATQLMSNSVADALVYCQSSGIPGFTDCDGTIRFIRVFNNLFDVMNSRSLRAKGWKRATASFNIEETQLFFETATIYISELKYANGEKVLNSNRSTGFLGFIICMKSLIHLYKTLIGVENAVLKYLCTYKLNQDHIELFFGAIRSKCGFNNNPSAKMFRAAYKKLIVHAEFKESATGNCLPLEEIKILNYSSQKFSKILNNCTSNDRILEHDESLVEVHDHDYIHDPTALTEYAKDVIDYIAGNIVRTLKKKLHCEKCLQSLESNESSYSLIAIKDRGGLIKPSHSTSKVCRVTEKVLREYELKMQSKMIGQPKHMTKMIFRVSNLLINTNIFAELNEHAMDNFFTENHRDLLIKTIAQNYLNIRIYYMTKKIVYNQEKIRSFLTKTITFKGQ